MPYSNNAAFAPDAMAVHMFAPDAMAVHIVRPGEPRLRRSRSTISAFEKVRTAAARRRSVFAAVPARATREPLGSR
jgi:hypothetical protein